MFKKPILERKTLGQLIVAFGFYLLPVIIFARLATEVPEGDTLPFDTGLLRWIHQFTNPLLTHLVLFFTNCGGPAITIAATGLAVAILYLRRYRRAALVLLLGVGGAGVINSILKLGFHRLRPHLWAPLVVEKSYSFPSGHAMVSSALAFSVMYILWHTRAKAAAIIIGSLYTFIIGLTRLYLGVHYPTDVLAGWLVGFTWIVVVRAVLSRSRHWGQKTLTQRSDLV